MLFSAAGKFSNSTGRLACDFCKPGTYIDVTGSTQCVSCAAGTYAQDIAATTCLPWSVQIVNGHHYLNTLASDTTSVHLDLSVAMVKRTVQSVILENMNNPTNVWTVYLAVLVWEMKQAALYGREPAVYNYKPSTYLKLCIAVRQGQYQVAGQKPVQLAVPVPSRMYPFVSGAHLAPLAKILLPSLDQFLTFFRRTALFVAISNDESTARNVFHFMPVL
uniref:Tyrosine-protein kinase ephrin type A/B receptor-like domain-containing protein n=1 Tax=Spongospora subterranea TaxID=70186 RepID=A0A0H5R3H5_9EUKA|eukprot:CRZ02549.1 hypothetical protein [Spongospora subterranea]